MHENPFDTKIPPMTITKCFISTVLYSVFENKVYGYMGTKYTNKSETFTQIGLCE